MATIRGGEKLDAALREMASKVANPATLRVGFLSSARYPSGEYVAMIAAIQEYGAPSRGIPPRPFFRNAIARYSPEWPKAIADLLKANDLDAKKTLDQTGAAIAGQLRQSVIDTNEPPNAPSTIRRKKSAKPLVDTGHLLASIDHEVKTS
jgi:hypothetical protein